MHTIKTTILADATGQITGYGLTIEAQAEGDQAEIGAIIASSLEIMLANLAARTQRPPAPAPAQPPAQAQPPAPAYSRPATPEEAEQRFFARYAAIVGGPSWQAVQNYLRSRAPKPVTVEGWIEAAEAVRGQAALAQQRDEQATTSRPPTAGRRSTRAAA